MNAFFGQPAARTNAARTSIRTAIGVFIPFSLVSLGPIAVAAAMSFVQGCGGDFDPGSRVTTVRVLGVRADVPYAAPGESVHLEALGVDPEQRPLTWGFGVCVNPSSSSPESCLEAFDRGAFTTTTAAPTFDVEIPSDVISRLPREGQARASVGAVVVACPGELTQTEGTIPFRCIDPNSGRALGTDEYVVGVKRIFARENDRNENPVIDGVTWDGAPWPRDVVKDVVSCDATSNSYKDCPTEQQHRLAIAIPGASIETGVDSLGNSFREQVIAQYYATEGNFEHDTRLASDTRTIWVARRQSAGQTVSMWLVVRDDRGGVTWEERQVRVSTR